MRTDQTKQRASLSLAETSEVQPRQGNRTAAEKLAILTEYESYPYGDPRRGALLRRLGIYTLHISKWRRLRDQGAIAGLTSQPAGRTSQPRNPLQDDLERLQKENARLQERLQKAETIIEVQKKSRYSWDCRSQRTARADAGRNCGVGANGGHSGCLYSFGAPSFKASITPSSRLLCLNLPDLDRHHHAP